MQTNQAMARRSPSSGVMLSVHGMNHFVPTADMLFLQADHVYVQIHTRAYGQILHRAALKNLLRQLPADQFLQTHRSFAVNTSYIRRWDQHYVYVGDEKIPISRTRRKAVLAVLNRE